MDELELARQQMFQRLSDLEQFYQGGDATNLMAQLQAQASGQNVPYTQNVLANMLADNSGASSAQFRGDQQTINRAFANSGMSGSGLQADAIRAILRLGGGCRVTTAQAIVRASEAQPTPSGGTISYDDLVPEGSEVTTAGPAVERFPKEVGS